MDVPVAMLVWVIAPTPPVGIVPTRGTDTRPGPAEQPASVAARPRASAPARRGDAGRAGAADALVTNEVLWVGGAVGRPGRRRGRVGAGLLARAPRREAPWLPCPGTLGVLLVLKGSPNKSGKQDHACAGEPVLKAERGRDPPDSHIRSCQPARCSGGAGPVRLWMTTSRIADRRPSRLARGRRTA